MGQRGTGRSHNTSRTDQPQARAAVTKACTMSSSWPRRSSRHRSRRDATVLSAGLQDCLVVIIFLAEASGAAAAAAAAAICSTSSSSSLLAMRITPFKGGGTGKRRRFCCESGSVFAAVAAGRSTFIVVDFSSSSISSRVKIRLNQVTNVDKACKLPAAWWTSGIGIPESASA